MDSVLLFQENFRVPGEDSERAPGVEDEMLADLFLS